LAKRLAQRRFTWLFCGLFLTACPPKTKLDPDASEKRYLLAADYFAKGMVTPALEELLKAVELNPENAEAHHLIGLVSLRKASETEELAKRAQCLRGEALKLEEEERRKHLDKAEEEFKLSLKYRADYSEAYNSLAVVEMHKGEHEGAIRSAEKALSNALYREPYLARGNLGWAYLHKRDYVRAAKALRQALFEQPQFCVGRYRLAKVYYEQREWKSAAEELQRVVGDSACPIQEAYHLAGLVALRLEQRTEAADFFRKCVELAPKACLARECQVAAGSSDPTDGAGN
jgi:tetratricopeptide (TPR) repeat protein